MNWSQLRLQRCDATFKRYHFLAPSLLQIKSTINIETYASSLLVVWSCSSAAFLAASSSAKAGTVARFSLSSAGDSLLLRLKLRTICSTYSSRPSRSQAVLLHPSHTHTHTISVTVYSSAKLRVWRDKGEQHTII